MINIHTTDRKIAVVYLARFAEGIKSFANFLHSYNQFNAGIEHQLYVIYKGYVLEDDLHEAKKIFHGINSIAIEVDDTSVDIGTYLFSANILQEEYICFLNTHSRVKCDQWLASLISPHFTHEAILTGATASYESLHDSLALISRINWLIYTEKIPFNFHLSKYAQFIIDSPSNACSIISKEWSLKREALHKLPLIRAAMCNELDSCAALWRKEYEDEWSAHWAWATSKDGPFEFLRDIPKFPNPHIRTNCFLVRRTWLKDNFPNVKVDKKSAYSFESGIASLTRKAMLHGDGSVYLVNSEGSAYPPSRWMDSCTFRLNGQSKLLIDDNQTRGFQLMSFELQELHKMMSWGVDVKSFQKLPTTGINFKSPPLDECS
jgi:hypothetical protein